MGMLARQWMGLSKAGDQVTVEPLPFTPAYLQSIDVEASLIKRGEVGEIFNADEMAHNFIRAYNGVIFTVGQYASFEFHGHNIRIFVKALQIVDLADKQRRGGQTSAQSGVVMEKTDVTVIKAADNQIKIRSSAKKYVFERG